MSVLSEEIAYAAGFFDGEGHIAIVRCAAHRKINRYGKVYFYETYQLLLEVGQKDKTPLFWMKGKFGGKVAHSTRKRSYDKELYNIWHWRLYGTNAAEFLKLLRPFLIVKAQEADVAIGFQATMERGRRRKHSSETMQFRHDAFDKIRQIRLAK
jgi:hypothetical protein